MFILLAGCDRVVSIEIVSIEIAFKEQVALGLQQEGKTATFGTHLCNSSLLTKEIANLPRVDYYEPTACR